MHIKRIQQKFQDNIDRIADTFVNSITELYMMTEKNDTRCEQVSDEDKINEDKSIDVNEEDKINEDKSIDVNVTLG